MTQTLHQRNAIKHYNNVVALRAQRMPEAWRHPAKAATAAVASPAVPAATGQRAQRWWALAAVAVLVIDIALIVGVLNSVAH